MENKLPAVTRPFLPFDGVRRFKRDFAAFVAAADERAAERALEAEGAELGDVCERCLVQSPCACPTGKAVA